MLPSPNSWVLHGSAHLESRVRHCQCSATSSHDGRGSIHPVLPGLSVNFGPCLSQQEQNVGGKMMTNGVLWLRCYNLTCLGFILPGKASTLGSSPHIAAVRFLQFCRCRITLRPCGKRWRTWWSKPSSLWKNPWRLEGCHEISSSQTAWYRYDSSFFFGCFRSLFWPPKQDFGWHFRRLLSHAH